tara:strand:+ start:21394 stop:22008 length:615 start_codon:yes stop_codon:yes gene_type:complete
MQIEQRKVAELTEDPNNARSHDQKNLAAIRHSLEAFGQQKPIVIDNTGKVVAGNGTLAAAKSMGWETIDTVVTRLEDEKQMAFAIADNRTAELAEWDSKILAEQLKELGDDVDMTGFDEEELENLLTDGEKEEQPEVTFSEFIGECNQYIVLKFDSDIDWLQAQSIFDIETMTSKRANGKPWSSGVGRVLDGPEAIAKITGAGK